MSAADLPDIAQHASSTAMARVLVTYLDDPRVIQQAIRNEFERPPALRTIQQMRAAHLTKLEKAPEKPFKPHEGYYPADASRDAEDTSRRLVRALERERALSAELAYQQGALDSPALRQPEIVDKAWDREAEAAWRQNGELR